MKHAHIASILAVAMAAMAGCKDGQTNSWFSQDASVQSEEGAYSILLHVLSSPDTHVQDAQRYKALTENDAGWKGLFIVPKVDHTELYWGRYATHKDARKNLEKAKAYVTGAGIKVYARSMIVPLPGKDVGPPEWNLLNAPGAYTVVVAVFYDVPEADYYGRRENAVEYCEQLRGEGEEAYYHHGPAKSTVTVGMFPDSAVQMIGEGDTVRPEVRDPRIDATVRKYRYLAVNGYSEKRPQYNAKTRRVEQVTSSPYPAHVPRRKGDEADDALYRVGDAQSW